jgi:RHS repeat-associated protein
LIDSLTTPSVKNTFYYDQGGRLTDAFGAQRTSYSYDGMGNRLTANIGDRESYVYDAGTHHLTSVGGKSRSYDADGNTIGMTDRELVYDARGRLATAKVNGVVEMNYKHNALGERVEHSIAGNRTVTMFDEAGHWLGDYASNGVPFRQIVWLDDWPLVLVEGGRLYDIQSDHIGSPRVLVDRSANRVVWTWSIAGEPFGADRPDEDPDGDGKLFTFAMRFPGQQFDDVTGLNYNYRRDYDPHTGRYVQSDPSGLAGGSSTYAYANGNPLLLFDRHGYAATDAPGALESLIPVWGSGREAVNDWSEGRYASAAWNAGLAVTDVVPGKVLIGAACKGVLKVAKGSTSLLKTARNVPISDPGRVKEINKTLDRMSQGGPHPHAKDGTIFENKERKLPPGDYREYTVDTPGAPTRGLRRVVKDELTGRTYYTDDHYKNFVQIEGP